MTQDRLLSEQAFHDAQAAERATRYAQFTQLRFTDSAYLDHEPWIRPAFARLGPLKGKQILDYGCGHGMASIVLARQGATVSGFDLSQGYIDEAKRRANANEVDAEFIQANAEELPFADHTFDAVWGCAILHHLDLLKAGRELRRVLKPNGIAVFCEPWGGNPVLEFARKYLPYAGKHRTPDERPLLPSDVAILRTMFPALELRGCQFFGMVRRVFSRVSTRGRWLDRWDQQLLKRYPSLEKWCRYVEITIQMS